MSQFAFYLFSALSFTALAHATDERSACIVEQNNACEQFLVRISLVNGSPFSEKLFSSTAKAIDGECPDEPTQEMQDFSQKIIANGICMSVENDLRSY